MKLLAIDVGAGTQDILFYDSCIEIANAIKAILPSQPKLLASRVETLTQLRKNIVVFGETMGGYPFGSAIKKHLKAGLKIAMTPTAAKSIRDDLDIVKRMNIDIISDASLADLVAKGYAQIEAGDLNLNALETAFVPFGVDFGSIDGIAVAVQDHGAAPKGESERKFRFERLLKPGIQAGGLIEEFAFKTGHIPQEFTRMCAVNRLITKHGFNGIVMDTGPAVLFGALEDEYLKTKNVVGVLNFGNQHTLGGIIKNNRMVAVYEHHTGLMDGSKAVDSLMALADETLTNEEVFNDRGHGAFVQERVGSSNIEALTVLGPRKTEMTFSSKEVLYHAAPFGDQMMAGPAGLILGAQKLL